MPPALLLFAVLFSAACHGTRQQAERGQATRILSLPKMKTCLRIPILCSQSGCCLNRIKEDISEYWEVSICAVLNRSKLDNID